MFTGIVEYVSSIELKGNDLIIDNKYKDLILGESISINGVCLTVDNYNNKEIFFKIGFETLEKTNLKYSKIVNVERALKVGDRIGGSFVSGHIDGIVKFLSKINKQNSYLMKYSMPKEKWAVVDKGSISLNGVNLTVMKKDLDSFYIQVIPHTYKETNFSLLKTGDKLNYEIDIFARYSRRSLYD